MMKKFVFFLILPMIYVRSADAASATGTGTISARVVSAVTVDENRSLSFGSMTGESGVVTVTPAGVRSSTSSNLVTDGSNPPASGELVIYGPINQVVYLSNINDIVLTSPGGASMNVANFQTDRTGSITLTSDDGSLVHVGAQLTVGNNQSAGDYTGTYSLVVTY